MSLAGLFTLLLGMPINDITTTPDAAPLLAGSPYPEKFKARQLELYPDLAPLKSESTPVVLFAAAESLARERKDWTITSAQGLRLEAVATTALLRFKDDIVLEARAEDGGSSLHMRSRSRVGRSDLGANAKRIRGFFEEVRERLKR